MKCSEGALHSFDIFDTLIQRTTLEPIGVFFRVQVRMRESHLNFPPGLIEDYPAARIGAESNVRYAYRSTFGASREITFTDIFQRLAGVYGLNAEQTDFLTETELECELTACRPRQTGVDAVLALLDRTERVVLISDMYLPETFVRRLLDQVEPRLSAVPLYLSSSQGGQKSTGELFELVAKAENVDFPNWTHYGDSPVADGVQPGRLGIAPVVHQVPQFNHFEQTLVRDLVSYDAYCLAALMARYRFDHQPSTAQEFTYTRVSLYLVTYVLWMLYDAVGRGIENLYFISRDGHHLKRIADAVIQEQRLGIATHYLYGSRKVWWIASFIDHVDPEFFLGLEGLKESCRFSDVLDSLDLDVQVFYRLFPQFPEWDRRTLLSPEKIKSVVQAAKTSKAYENHVLELAESKRLIVCQYLRESVGLAGRSAFVEYWGRGFTQTCFSRLLSCSHGAPVSTEFYYARSIYQSDAVETRRNFTVSKASLLPVERLFANFPHGTVTAYEQGQDGVQAVTSPRQHDEVLFAAMEALLPQFALDVCRAGFFGKEDTLRRVFDWSIRRFSTDLSDRVVWESFAHLKDVNRAFGDEIEFAPVFDLRTLWRILLGRRPDSGSVEISLKRSHWFIRKIYPVVVSLRRDGSL